MEKQKKPAGAGIITRSDGTIKHRNPVIAKAKITSKGQVTIPAPIRKTMGLKDGDDISFQFIDGAIQIKKMTAIDRLAISVGPKLREEFPTPEAFNAYLKTNRKNIIEKIYGDCDTESSD